jgi:hypothetical protein
VNAFLVSTGIVALAEIGDKTQLLAFILAARFRRPLPIAAGILVATLLNHAAAGALGAWLTALATPETLRWALGLSFIAMALWTLVPDEFDAEDARLADGGVFVTTLVAFFLAEMGDKTQDRARRYTARTPRGSAARVRRARRRTGRPQIPHHRRGIRPRRCARAFRPGHLDAGADAAGAGHAGAEAQYVGPTLRGEMLWCQGYSEPARGRPRQPAHVRGRRMAIDFVINGQKIWTSTAHEADMMFCLVRTEADAPKHHGISYLLFPMNTPGIEVRPLTTMTGHASFNEVFFTDVRVPEDRSSASAARAGRSPTPRSKFERGMLGDPNEASRRFGELVELLREKRWMASASWTTRCCAIACVRLQGKVLAMRYNGMRLLRRLMESTRRSAPRAA